MDDHVRFSGTKKGTTLIMVTTINVVKTVVKYGVVPRAPHVS